MTTEPARRRWLGPLGVRLALAFVVAAFAAVAVVAGLTALGAQREVDTLASRQRQDQADAAGAAAGQAYEAAGGWERADLHSAVALATSAGAAVEVRDQDGRLVALPVDAESMMRDLMSRMHRDTGTGSMMDDASPTVGRGPSATAAVTTPGGVVGSVRLRFPSGLSDTQRQVNDALLEVVGLGAGLAALVALAVAVFVSRRISRPVVALTATVAAFEAGDREARVAMPGAPGELGELAAAFDRMADSLSRQDQLRRALVADVAHELRTPVTILQASCEALVDGVRAPTVEQLSSLHDETLRLGRIVGDLETLAAAEAAGLHLDRRPVDLAAVARDAIATVAVRAEAAGVSLDARLGEVVVDGDSGRLHQIVVNLVTNAVKYTPAGGHITVSVAGNGHLARLEVADTGPGIPEAEAPHVFDRFWRGSTAGSTAGSGIGLAVVAELVRAHHGQIHLDSQPGRGSRFMVLLPAA